MARLTLELPHDIKDNQQNMTSVIWSWRLALLAVAVYIASTDVAMPQSTQRSPFENVVQELVEGNEIVGLAMAVVRGGEISVLKTYGVREFGRSEQIDAHTTFRIASLSKSFAATIAGDLIRQEKLSLQNKIGAFNSDFQLADPTQTGAVTIEDVLSHRLSLPPYAYDNLLEAGVAPSKILGEMKRVSPICKVSSCYAYQNVGFNLIASAIESVTDTPFETVVQTRLFNPLDMTGASFGVDGLKQHSNWARSHRRSGIDAWEVREVKQPYYDVPAAGGINANILDMAKWLKAQMGHSPEVLDQATLQLMHRPIVATPAELRRNKRVTRLTDAHYGLGWRIYQYAGQTVINHSGSVEGYSARIAFLPKQDVGIVLLANSRSREFWDILPLFLDHELGLDNPMLSEISKTGL